MNNYIYVIGHKHPDSDSICAAITYADLLNHLGKEAVACRQGPLNDETKFILKRFHQETPLLLSDARAMLKDIQLDEPTFIKADETVHHAWHVMLQTQNRSLFVMNQKDELCGICTTSNLAKVRIHPDADLEQLMSTAKLENIARTVGGTVVTRPEDFHSNGSIHVITLDGREIQAFHLNHGICILSSDSDKQRMCIDAGAKLLVITCGQFVDQGVLEYAKDKQCAIIKTDFDTMHTARTITESYSVEEVMTRHIISFEGDEYVDDVAVKMNNSRVRSYPVKDENGTIIGAVSRYHTRNYRRRQFALVDHSAMNQTINHLDQAEVVAIVDHHHIGDVQTDAPIEYRNHKCGSTCTILSEIYQENGLLPDHEMSGLLLSAILSDTLNLKSATTTSEDQITVKWLAERAGIADVDAYAREMLGASIALTDASPHDILTRDLKTYEIGRFRFAIGQTNYSHMEEVQKILPQFRENLKKEQAEYKLDLMVMLFTDVMGAGSLFVYYGPLSYVLTDLIKTKFDDHSGFDPNIISRKQQLMPKLSEILKNI
ncbi:MAG: putative manganese-dependent inorganic diphosphatase [Solobacterium sp.]|jgi:manganese-dependent inorganic pyrophosphatase|nr:putative manganese-dependent inorganic diphosphatase [Solobacterium sp.]MCH4205150.1 putative manganese-dependent inorganic diphosphatase [Solobacterium sp.]MCH4226743.1 putative manganese-dependent inorganic diphosphatase [Solobacterium sp.]MCH4281928.1 putative manganese-dependent inorganic diphosphatase [Solobacterium sp.]